ncbi:Gag-pol polyprotein-like protein [Theobroma cacao]|uniref:Gag-pol polyprotein-like protein n=1 Tax=Theobroma cacao TaxID=3641 RepID=S1RW51_THECC|nr:Gag-pol polyprotein-like protein [Theobroma cacao]
MASPSPSNTAFSFQSPPVFNGENYPIWSEKMESYLRGLDLWDVVESGAEVPALKDNATPAQVKQHHKEVAKRFRALSYIQGALTDAMFVRIMGCKTAKDAWERLKVQFEGSERTKEMQIMNLTREFDTMRMKDSENAKDFISRLMRVVNQLRLSGEDISERRVVQKALVSLSERFEATVASLERELSKMSLSDVAYALQAAEHRRVMRSESVTENVLFAKMKGKTVGETSTRKGPVEQKGKDKGVQSIYRNQQKKGKAHICSHCKRKGHAEVSCWFRPNVRCRNCNQLGHVQRVCKNKVETQVKADEPVEKAETAEEHLFMAQTGNFKTVDASLWFLDSGASNHMTPNVKLFVEIDDQYRSKVEIGNGVYLQATGKRLVPIQTSSGARYEFEVLLVPEITKNLLSVGQMLKHNHVLLFKDMSCTIYAPNGDYMMNISMKQNCFPVNWKDACLQATDVHSNLTSLWNKRFGHCNYNSLIQLSNSGLADKLPKL